ncbi:uncharacterized protein LOC122254125 [Penaeus japonicus]|uniref:uncharacterized protein LOC122254125 n=1 Tax=Penaeus japonicus TaxID=27405 RepID=UPI001C70F161|nr:uncharacterized protein LOC122254125 [Penaeus japonicus]
MERVYREKYALMIWDISYTMNFGHDCRAFMLPESYFPIHTSFALAKGSPFIPIMNKVVLDIISSGIMIKWWRELTVTQADCNALTTAPIELKTVLTPFLLLGLSIVASLGFLVVERLVKRPSKSARQGLIKAEARGTSDCCTFWWQRH